MDSDRMTELLEDVITRLDDLQRRFDRLSVDVERLRLQGDELTNEIKSVKRAVEDIDPIL